MSKASVIRDVNVTFEKKEKVLAALTKAIDTTAKAKAALETAKFQASTITSWKELTNDKSRDAYLKAVCNEQYAAVEKAQEDERQARLDLEQVDLKIDQIRLLVKINCEWRGE